MKKPKCPKCGAEMLFIYGCGWDYDRWVCLSRMGKLSLCDGEIELETTTEAPEE